MRARLALRLAEQSVQIREILLKDKPAELLAISPKATVPVLWLDTGQVIEESIDITEWAFAQNDPARYQPQNAQQTSLTHELITGCDGDFKYYLDRYKYSDRYPQQPQHYYREQCQSYLDKLTACLHRHHYLIRDTASVADIAIFPFVRQFAMVDITWFRTHADACLMNWLDNFLQSALFESVMKKFSPWQPNSAPIYL